MGRPASTEIALSLLIVISLGLHLVGLASMALPDTESLFAARDKTASGLSGMRDIIVNINQDDRRQITKKTLYSDRDSRARGFITRRKGDRWLNNSLDFKLSGGASGSGKNSKAQQAENRKVLLSKNYEVALFLKKGSSGGNQGRGGHFDRVAIPDKNDVTLENAIYYSNEGRFSFNTAKFRHYQYFKAMKDRIASNWYPPDMANMNLGGYAPGSVRFRAIPAQKVKLVFLIDRSGKVLDVRILDSYGNNALDASCVDAIKLSRSFGKVPAVIRGDPIIIPFIFGYFVR